jgi:hypothetical protein
VLNDEKKKRTQVVLPVDGFEIVGIRRNKKTKLKDFMIYFIICTMIIILIQRKLLF